MKTINVYNYKYSQKRKKGGDIHHRYILITYCDGIAWKKGYPHTLSPYSEKKEKKKISFFGVG
jgi:hypothetical protein